MTKTDFGAAVVLAVIVASCGDGIGDVTTGSSPSSTPTPRPQSTPGPGASPTPAPAATPTPAPTTGLTCNLTALPNCDDQCCRSGGTVLFRSEIENAQSDLTRTQPGLFLPNGNVRSNTEYIAALARRLTQLTGLCSQPLGHDELRVKRDQNTAQHIDVLIADETPWVGGAYTCNPASF